MKKPLEVWQFVASIILVLTPFVILAVNQSNRIQYQGDRIIFLEQATSETKSTLHEISGKLTDILVTLQNKEDRPDVKRKY